MHFHVNILDIKPFIRVHLQKNPTYYRDHIFIFQINGRWLSTVMFLTISACFTEVNVQKFLQMLLLATKYFHSGKEMSVKSMYFKNIKFLLYLSCVQAEYIIN